MSSQDQRSDWVVDLALLGGRPIAEVGDAGSEAGMTVTIELDHDQEPERLCNAPSVAPY